MRQIIRGTGDVANVMTAQRFSAVAESTASTEPAKQHRVGSMVEIPGELTNLPCRSDYPQIMKPIATLGVVALDTRDPQSLATFYGSILGWEIDADQSDETWVQLRSPSGATLAFQAAPHHVAPTWPSDTDHLQAHFDFYVDDLDIAEQQALAVGAQKSEFQPHPISFRVYFDPAGHPFCLCRSSADG